MMNERDLFAALPTIDEAVSQRLHQRLVDVANAAGLLDVAYRTIETPVGTLLLAATARGLVRVAYASENNIGTSICHLEFPPRGFTLYNTMFTLCEGKCSSLKVHTATSS